MYVCFTEWTNPWSFIHYSMGGLFCKISQNAGHLYDFSHKTDFVERWPDYTTFSKNVFTGRLLKLTNISNIITYFVGFENFLFISDPP